MRMENLKILLTFGIILIVPVVLMPQFFIGLLILIVACLAFRGISNINLIITDYGINITDYASTKN